MVLFAWPGRREGPTHCLEMADESGAPEKRGRNGEPWPHVRDRRRRSLERKGSCHVVPKSGSVWECNGANELRHHVRQRTGCAKGFDPGRFPAGESRPAKSWVRFLQSGRCL